MSLRLIVTRLLLVLAILGQASVPTLHAQNWASNQANPALAFAFCGSGSAALLAKLQDNPLAKLASVGQLHSDADQQCRLCVLMASLGALMVAFCLVLLLDTPARKLQDEKKRLVTPQLFRRYFQARAPPCASFS